VCRDHSLHHSHTREDRVAWCSILFLFVPVVMFVIAV